MDLKENTSGGAGTKKPAYATRKWVMGSQDTIVLMYSDLWAQLSTSEGRLKARCIIVAVNSASDHRTINQHGMLSGWESPPQPGVECPDRYHLPRCVQILGHLQEMCPLVGDQRE